MKQMMCSKCKKRPAMFFITKMEGDKSSQEGLCVKCALEMNIGPIKQMMQNMGISEEEMEEAAEQYEELFTDNGTFEPGGAGTMPFMQGFFGNAHEESKSEEEEKPSAPAEKKKHRRKDQQYNKDNNNRYCFLFHSFSPSNSIPYSSISMHTISNRGKRIQCKYNREYYI